MFRKIRSSRDPSHTFAKELYRELQPYFAIAARRLYALGERYPKLLFTGMVIHIVVSVVLILAVFNKAAAPYKTRQHRAGFSALRRDMEQISEAGAALKEIMLQKRIIDSITAKSVLTSSDSVALGHALDKLTALNNNLIRLKK